MPKSRNGDGYGVVKRGQGITSAEEAPKVEPPTKPNVFFIVTAKFEGDDEPFSKDSLIYDIAITNKAPMAKANVHPMFFYYFHKILKA